MKRLTRIILISFIIMMLILFLLKTFKIEKRIWQSLYPKQYEEYVNQYSQELDIDPLLTFAIIKTESNFQSDTVSKSGAVGLMQLMNTTAREQAKKLGIEYEDAMLYNPEKNIQLGLHYFGTLLEHFQGNYILAFAAYNAGLGNVEKWVCDGLITKEGEGAENIPFKETNMYVRKVIRNYKLYKEIYVQKEKN